MTSKHNPFINFQLSFLVLLYLIITFLPKKSYIFFLPKMIIRKVTNIDKSLLLFLSNNTSSIHDNNNLKKNDSKKRQRKKEEEKYKNIERIRTTSQETAVDCPKWLGSTLIGSGTWIMGSNTKQAATSSSSSSSILWVKDPIK